MRDFRDAKAMAQTLREALNAKSVSLTHSEVPGTDRQNPWPSGLECAGRQNCVQQRTSRRQARYIGAGDGITASRRTIHPANPRVRKLPWLPSILDDYVGFYQFNDNAVFTVTREADHLLTRLTGQIDVPFHPQSPTEFFSEVVDAQITFVGDERGPATSVILHQGGVSYPMQRIDATTAQQITSRTEEKVKSQSASPGTEAALRRLIEGIISGKPNYDEMSAMLAEATRQQLPNLQSGLAELRAVQSVRFLGVGAQGEDVYSVRHENGASHWRIALDSKRNDFNRVGHSGPVIRTRLLLCSSDDGKRSTLLRRARRPRFGNDPQRNSTVRIAAPDRSRSGRPAMAAVAERAW